MRFKKLLHGIIWAISILVPMACLIYCLVFSTAWGFALFFRPLNQVVNESNKQSVSQENWGNFDYETYTKQAFARKYFEEDYVSDARLKEKLNELYPADSSNDGLIVYLHHYLCPENNGDILIKTFGINKYTDFVYVTDKLSHEK